jgi:hypothetical protein
MLDREKNNRDNEILFTDMCEYLYSMTYSLFKTDDTEMGLNPGFIFFMIYS